MWVSCLCILTVAEQVSFNCVAQVQTWHWQAVSDLVLDSSQSADQQVVYSLPPHMSAFCCTMLLYMAGLSVG